MFSDSCEACLVGYEFAERAHAEQLVFDGGSAAVESIELSHFDDEVIIFITVADYPEGELFDSDGEVQLQFDAALGRQTVYQAVRREDGELMIIASEAL
jgi:hypothetical protein